MPQRQSFLSATRHAAAGRSTTLKAFEDEVIRPMREEQVHFATN